MLAKRKNRNKPGDGKEEAKMRFGGVQKTSFIDYPGEISAVLFTQGCNYNCAYCHNADLIPFKDNADESERVIADLVSRKKNVRAVTITGGEPTLQRDLPQFMKRLKDEGFKVKLDTNGSNPDSLKMILSKGLADYVAMDAKTSLKRYPELAFVGVSERVQAASRIIMDSGAEYEFRTTAFPPLVGENEMQDISQWLDGAENYYLQQFNPAYTNNPEAKFIAPYPVKTLSRLLEIIRPSVKNASLRGVDVPTPVEKCSC